jgi:hypothetical protein
MAPSTAFVRNPQLLPFGHQSREERDAYRPHIIRANDNSKARSLLARRFKDNTTSYPPSYPFHKNKSSLLLGPTDDGERSLLFDRRDDDNFSNKSSSSRFRPLKVPTMLKRLTNNKKYVDATLMVLPPAIQVRKANQKEKMLQLRDFDRPRNGESRATNDSGSIDDDENDSFLQGLHESPSGISHAKQQRAQIWALPLSPLAVSSATKMKSSFSEGLDSLFPAAEITIDRSGGGDDMSSILFDGGDVRDKQSKPPKSILRSTRSKVMEQLPSRNRSTVSSSNSLAKRTNIQKKHIPVELDTIDVVETRDDDMSSILFDGDDVWVKLPTTVIKAPSRTPKTGSNRQEQTQSRTESPELTLPRKSKSKTDKPHEIITLADTKEEARQEIMPSKFSARGDMHDKSPPLSSYSRKTRVETTEHTPAVNIPRKETRSTVAERKTMVMPDAREESEEEAMSSTSSDGVKIPHKKPSLSARSTKTQKTGSSQQKQVEGIAVLPNFSIPSKSKMRSSRKQENNFAVIHRREEKKLASPKLSGREEGRDNPPPPILSREVESRAKEPMRTREASPAFSIPQNSENSTSEERKFIPVTEQSEKDDASAGDEEGNDVDSGNDGGDECSFEQGNMSPILSNNKKKNFAVQETHKLSARTIRIVGKSKVSRSTIVPLDCLSLTQSSSTPPTRSPPPPAHLTLDGPRSRLSPAVSPPGPPPSPASLSFASYIGWSGIGSGVTIAGNLLPPPPRPESPSASSLSISSIISWSTNQGIGLFQSGNDKAASSQRQYPASVA